MTTVALATMFASSESSAEAFTVMSFNIRYDNPNDTNLWSDRKMEVAEVIAKADIAGLQEALKHQIDEIEPGLKDYQWIGVGRDDGKSSGEHACIFYRKDRFEVLDQGTFWLSEEPDVPGSKSWDASITRIVTWAKFNDKRSGAEFYFFNTHFDHRGSLARKESAKLLISQIANRANDSAAIVTGDFNTGEHSAPYKTLVDGLRDARYMTGKAPLGPRSTSTSWTEVKDRPSPIDYIFVNDLVDVIEVENITTTFRGLYPSDHLPVKAVVVISK